MLSFRLCFVVALTCYVVQAYNNCMIARTSVSRIAVQRSAKLIQSSIHDDRPISAFSSTDAISANEKKTTSAVETSTVSSRTAGNDLLKEGRRYVENILQTIDHKKAILSSSATPVAAATVVVSATTVELAKNEPGRWPPVATTIEAPAIKVDPITFFNSPSVFTATVTKTDRKTEVAKSSSNKLSLANLADKDLRGKRVLVRCDLNVPLTTDASTGQLVISDDTRIRASIPTLQYLVSHGAKVFVTSHLGRPKGKGYEAKYSLAPVAKHLSTLLQQSVPLVPDCVGLAVDAARAKMQDGEVVLLENVRFYQEEEANDAVFAQSLAKDMDVYVNDAFGTAHRAHASTAGVAKYITPSVAGFLVNKELQFLQGAITQAPKRPFAAIVGGSKVSSKIAVIEAMLEKVDVLVLGGGMVFTFLKARGVSVGKSLVEDDQLALATRLEAIAKERGVTLILAEDVMVAEKFANDAAHKVVPVQEIPADWMGLDIGPISIQKIEQALQSAQTILWNGPMGVFEMSNYAKGTHAIAHLLAKLTEAKGTVTIIGGGDSVAAVEQVGLAEKMTHISTGGGASLELLEGKVLPGIAALNNA